MGENGDAAPPQTCREYYELLQKQCSDAVRDSFDSDAGGLHARSHSFVRDLEVWLVALDGTPERDMLIAAMREYQFALLAVVQAQYRQAFTALRLCFELLLSAVQLSANELELRTWLRGDRDLNWSALADADTGLFSKKFARAFFEELEEQSAHYRAMAGAVYRECSEYVHGNAHTLGHLPDGVAFDQAVFREWHGKAQTVRLVSVFALCVRHLRQFDASRLHSLESVVLDNVGFIPQIRTVFGSPVEPSNG